MKTFYAALFMLVTSLFASAQQIDCSNMGLSVNVSDTDYVKLYHPAPYLLWPQENNVIYWEISDFQGGLIHQDTTYGANGGHMGFYHSVPFSDSMYVRAINVNDSVLDFVTGGSPYPLACLVADTLYWKPDTISPTWIMYRWEFVGAHTGVSVLSGQEGTIEISIAEIYPNPADSKISIANLPEGVNTIRVYSSLGQQIFKHDYAVHDIEISTSNWPGGHYTVWVNEKPIQSIHIIH